MGTELKEDVRKNDLPAVDVRSLAWFAESADGRRSVKQVLYRENGKVLIGPEDEFASKAILRVTQPRGTRRTAIRRPPLDDIPEDADAIFLGDSAVEKFLFPYYEAQRLMQRGELERLKKEFYKESENYVGIIHVQPSHPKLLRATGEVVDFPVKTVVSE